MVYQATVESPMGKETYIGLTRNQLKTRFRNHTASFRNESKRNANELSKKHLEPKRRQNGICCDLEINGSRQAVFKRNKEMLKNEILDQLNFHLPNALRRLSKFVSKPIIVNSLGKILCKNMVRLWAPKTHVVMPTWLWD